MDVPDQVIQAGRSREGHDLDAWLAVARAAVACAAAYVRDHLPGAVAAKGDRDLVSDVDLAVERLVRDFLHQHAPGVAFGGEEYGFPPGVVDEQWVLDPVDGTVNFVHGIPLCAVSLALRRGDRAVLGVIAAPFLGTSYWAAEGRGAFRNGQPIMASRRHALDQAVVAVGDYGTGAGAASRNRAAVSLHRRLADQVQRVRMLGSAAMDLVWVAEGALDASITLGNRVWDMAAGVVIAREAGAVVVDVDGSPHDCTSAITIAVAEPLALPVTELVRAAMREGGHLPA
ncbi:inositol monophosphatase family protein [Plantactinospora mayteni]|uniref:inositol monophosphatase family protein n=1 Tax=Plantactinospora mayteni TaxID=566021 RepID=UPI001940AB0B|nr:inositol monophosphatase family protein [Plantactinospora mayteni]